MSQKYSALFLVLCLAAFTSRGDAAGFSCESSTKQLSADIQRYGASNVLTNTYKEGDWATFLRCVATGSRPWVQIAVSFRRVSSGATDQLNSVIGEALGNQPDVVLEVARASFSLDEICGAPDVDDPRFDSYNLAVDEIDRRIRALGTVKNPRFSQDIASCTASLNDAKLGVERFYKS